MTATLTQTVTRGLGAAWGNLETKLGGPARVRAVLILASVLSVDSADKGTIGALAPQLEAQFHIGNFDIGLLVAISSLLGALATLPMGVLTDRVSRTRLLWVSIVIWGGAEAVSAFSVSYAMLLVTRVALGLVTATAGPAVASLTGDLFPAKERSQIYSYVLTGELLGAGAGLLVAGDIGSAVDWRVGFLALVIPSLILAWVVARFLPEPARGGQSRLGEGDERMIPAEEAAADQSGGADGSEVERADTTVLDQVEAEDVDANPDVVLDGNPAQMSLREAVVWVLKVRTNVLLIVSSSLGYFFFAGLKTFAVLFARGRFGISESIATLLAVAVGAAAIVGTLIGGRTADRLLGRGRIDARLVVGAVGYLGAAVVLVPALFTTDLAIALPLVMVAGAALAAPNSPGDAARLDVVPSRMWGRTESIRTLLRSVLEAFAPLLFGFVSEQLGSRASAGFGSGVNSKAAHISAASAQGLAYTFLVMLLPLALGGYFLLRARRTYPADVAAAGESERQSRPAVDAGNTDDRAA